jgi:hypothetical protein
MKRLFALLLLTVSLLTVTAHTEVLAPVPPVVLQIAPDCSSGCNGPTDEEYSSSQQACTFHANTSCGSGCTCQYGFLLAVTNGAATPRWFNIAIRDGKAILGDPGPLLRHRCQKGDEIYRINGRIPTRAAFTRFTRRQPAKYAEARWDSQGRLQLRLWR